MIGSSSNAVSMFALPRSSLGTVTNTVDLNYIIVKGFYYLNGTRYTYYANTSIENGRLKFSYKAPDGAYIDRINFGLGQLSQPPVGNYAFSMDMSSDIGMNVSQAWIYSVKQTDNASNQAFNISLPFVTQSGDVYVEPFNVTLTRVATFTPFFRLSDKDVNMISGSVAFNFAPISESGEIVGGYPMSDDAYHSDVSNSLSNLSSSVDSMTEDLSSAAENLEYISTSQNLIIQGIDNVIMHISDQLYAFWDQLYNLIHVPTMAKMDDIISAINNMDLEIEVNLDGLKSTINNMSSAVQNKLQSTTDQITGGYDNSGITQENEKLEQSINQYDEVESGIFEDAEGFIGDFEYPSVESLPFGIIKALAFVGSFLQGIFLCMGEFSVIITFSLTMIFVMVVVGYHRIRS